MSHINFLGIPVEGDIRKTEVRAAQRSLSELEPLIRALLDDDTIVEFGWRQYTPYFMDGDPCIFSASGIWVRTVTDKPANEEDNDLSVEYRHPSLGEIVWEYVGIPRERRMAGYNGPDLSRLERCNALDQAIQSGAFDDVLIEAFGDHADITIRRDGITIRTT